MPLSDSERKHLEYEFHCAGYHLLLEMITGLHTVMGHLVREVHNMYIDVHCFDVTLCAETFYDTF